MHSKPCHEWLVVRELVSHRGMNGQVIRRDGGGDGSNSVTGQSAAFYARPNFGSHKHKYHEN